jgi:dihydrofolate reductase
MIRAIVACDALGGIAKDGIMPWPHNMADLKHFKQLTTDAIVVMGRKTWEAPDMPSPLPNRTNVVVTRNTDYQLNEASVLSDNISLRLTSLAQTNKVFVIGGAALFEQVIDDISILHLTRVAGDHDCDTFLPMDKIAAQFVLIDSVEIDRTTKFEIYLTRKLHDLSIGTTI